MTEKTLIERVKFPAFLLALQLIFIILFGVFVDYDSTAHAGHAKHSLDMQKGGSDPDSNQVRLSYPMFQDIHVMMFIGFGFLMTFLKKYGFSSVGLNFLIAAFVIQWSTLMLGFLHLHHGKILLNITSLITADFAAAAVLISFGALLGKTSPLQLIVMAFFEIILFSVNEWVGLSIFKAADVGGSMFVHVFGAYFGLSVARVLFTEDVHKNEHNEGSNYHSDIFAMIGTIFLWMFWPSFNAGLAPGDDQHRAVINTYYSLAACCVVTFAISYVIKKEGKLDMVHIQNATLAGGVAVGTTADMMIGAWGALVIGCVAAVLSVVGYTFITPFLTSKLKVHDTCGVNNLHGMPGILAALGGIVASAIATTDTYGYSLYTIFPARAPMENSTEFDNITKMYSIDAGVGRSAGEQAGYQCLALAVTLIVAIVGGILTGFILKLSVFEPVKGSDHFSDVRYWEVPADDEAPLVSYTNGSGDKTTDKLLNETEMTKVDDEEAGKDEAAAAIEEHPDVKV